jgi:hypothetical protein
MNASFMEICVPSGSIRRIQRTHGLHAGLSGRTFWYAAQKNETGLFHYPAIIRQTGTPDAPDPAADHGRVPGT